MVTHLPAFRRDDLADAVRLGVGLNQRHVTDRIGELLLAGMISGNLYDSRQIIWIGEGFPEGK